ncbi:MAG: chemotaxis protein CheB [Actinomycetota bacterium]
MAKGRGEGAGRRKRKASAGPAEAAAEQRRGRGQRDAELFVVGIGASAGGLEALRPLVANLPAASNMAYVVVQHLSPQYRSMMAQLLARETELEVVEITDGTPVVANKIFLTPPNTDLRIKNGVLTLRQPSMPLGPKPSIDLFFSTLAEDCGHNAVGVILSGTGTDGAHGMRVLKAKDGFTIVQVPESAKYDGMPKASIDTGCVDLVVKPEDIGRELSAITKFPRPVLQPQPEAGGDIMRRLFRLVGSRTGIDFSQYKSTTIRRRLERRMIANRIDGVAAYVDYVKDYPAELDLLCKDVLISVTSFFRDAKEFDEARAVLAELVAAKKAGDGIRLWVPGCATGEEAYSFAFMLHDLLGERVNEYKVQVFATDIDTDAMNHARRGIYAETTLERVDPATIDRYFDPIGHSFQVRKAIREMVVFARQDLAKDPPFVKIDLISCRNVLIYFNTDLQDRVLRVFHYSLNPEGCLFLGKSEAVGRNTDLFRAVRTNSKLFQKRLGSTRPEVALPGFSRPVVSESLRTDPRRQPAIEDLVKEGFVAACMPPSVAINEDLEVVYYHGDVKRFLRFPEGSPTTSLAKLVAEEFRSDLRALAHRAKTSKAPCGGPFRQLRTEAGEYQARLLVRPLPLDRRETLMLVSWEMAEHRDPVPADAGAAEDELRNAELEQELTATREHLQTVVEELETSNEELQAVNEELQAANEELQSSNEELETANEELQATNEELTTVNQELHIRTTELAEANADLINIQDNIGFPLVVVDNELRLTRYTPQAVRLFGILSTDIGQPVTSLPNHLQITGLRDRLRGVVTTAEEHEDEIHNDGRILRLRIVPCRDQAGRINGAALTLFDETEIRTARDELQNLVADLRCSQDQLRAAKEAAEQVSQAKSAFLARMSHELRTPLNAILGFSEILMTAQLDEAKRLDYLQAVRDSGTHLLTLIDDLLDISRIEAGKVTLRESEVAPALVIGFVVDMLRERANAGQVGLVIDCPHGLPAVRCDEVGLRRVLLNIVGNAIKFTPAGGRVEIRAVASPGGLWIAVEDTGPGIAAEDLARIMEPFEQGSLTAHHSQEGVGLGLPIARSLVILHGGAMDFASTPGKGTTVTVSIPPERLVRG